MLGFNNAGANASAGLTFALGVGSANFTNEGANPSLLIANGASGGGNVIAYEPYKLIYTHAELNGVDAAHNGTGATTYGAGLGGNYALAGSLSLTGTYGAAPIGSTANFTGGFDGLGHTISGLTVSASGDNVGLFGQTTGTIRNLGMVGGAVSGSNIVGGLVGAQNGGTITNGYWDVGTTGRTVSAGDGTGLTTAQLQGGGASFWGRPSPAARTGSTRI